jgi:hypothetical protein
MDWSSVTGFSLIYGCSFDVNINEGMAGVMYDNIYYSIAGEVTEVLTVKQALLMTVYWCCRFQKLNYGLE